MKYTSEVFQRLCRGQFVSSNSVDATVRAIYTDIEENQEEYEAYFRKIEFQLCSGNGFYYFGRKETKVIVENKLQSLFSWIDYLDFLKTYDTSFGPGTQFSLVQMEVKLSTMPGLKEKLGRMFHEKTSNHQKLEALAKALEDMGFAEKVNETDESYHVTNAFNYIEQLILCINIKEEYKDEIPQ